MMRKLADELKIGEVVVSGETILSIRDVIYDNRKKLELVLQKPNGRKRTALWGKYSTISMQKAS